MFERIRKVIRLAFTEHPHAAGESYWQHFAFTMKMGAGFTCVGLIILIHGTFPFLFTKTAGDRIEKLYATMKERSLRHQQDHAERLKLRTRKPHEDIAGEARIAIVGGGFSGLMVLANMIRDAKHPMTIEWCNARDSFGTGFAYGTKFNQHLLTVRADRMGAFAGQPEGFYQWLRTAKGITRTARVWPGNEFEKDSYLPRLLYGEYLKHIMEEALNEAEGKGIRVTMNKTLVRDASLTNAQAQQLLLSLGQEKHAKTLLVDAMVLATGNLPPHNFSFLAGSIMPDIRTISDSAEIAKHIKYLGEEDDIVIVGTGLAMADMVLTLKAKGYKGKITAISRNGLLPAIHAAHQNYPAWSWIINPQNAPHTALALLRGLRQEIERAKGSGYDWRAVVDSLQPVTHILWQRLSIHEKRRFLVKLMPLWTLHYHRMPPQNHAQLCALQEQGKLTIIAGVIAYTAKKQQAIALHFHRRGQDAVEVIYPALVINCTEPEGDIAHSSHELLKNLCDRELIMINALRKGVDITSAATAKGKAFKAIFPVGTLLSGEYFDCTTVVDIRDGTNVVAQQVLRRVNQLTFS